MDIGNKIQAIRTDHGMTQAEFAERLHVTRQTISKWEKGISVPDAEKLAALAEELEMPVADLLGENIEGATEENAIVTQLARLNEQMAIKNRRARRIWKALIIATIVMLIGPMILVVCNMYILGTSESEGLPGGYKGTTKWIFSCDDQETSYE